MGTYTAPLCIAALPYIGLLYMRITIVLEIELSSVQIGTDLSNLSCPRQRGGLPLFLLQLMERRETELFFTSSGEYCFLGVLL